MSNREELAESDPNLPEICFGTRPLYGIEGVMVSIADASKTPYEQVFQGRINPGQAQGLKCDLDLMLRLQASEPVAQALNFVRRPVNRVWELRDEEIEAVALYAAVPREVRSDPQRHYDALLAIANQTGVWARDPNSLAWESA
jgi:hypothetical protein